MIRVNEAGWDRALRVLIGGTLLYLSWAGTLTGWIGAVFMVVGLILALTGLVGWCPLYSLFGVSTNHRSAGARHS